MRSRLRSDWWFSCRGRFGALLALIVAATVACRNSAAVDGPRDEKAAATNGNGPSDSQEKADEGTAKNAAKYVTESLRGRVVFAAEATARRLGVKSVDEAAERILALEAPDGTLYPLIEDVRARAFRADKTLREFDVELLVRKHEGTPMRQVIGVYALKKDGKYEVDYWCDVCAIAMFELKPCECCQAMNYLRLRKVAE
ncbi:MAG: hypothetical protein DCC68_03030 [Planctomycetota bacterium]|nr:MAG: hypothetical protein DCC68_03030 [Planctomycetota bacterium]